jgi:N-methylhydantoinase B
MKEIIDAGEKLTRLAIEKIPDGIYRFEDHCDSDAISETPIKIATQVTVQGSDIEVDFTGSSPQVRGGMNAPLAVTVSATCYAIKCLTDPENEPNSGSYRPIKVVAPAGSVVNPIAPAPVVAGNHETASRIADTIIGALATALPDKVCAAGSGSSGILSLGARVRDGSRERELLLVEPHGSGQGANRDGDGVNARRVSIGNTGNTPCEVMEMTFPIHIQRYAISNDGGGAGRRRGGTGILREIRLEHDATVTLTAERAKFGPYGLFGGLAAPKAEFWARLPDGTEHTLNSKTAPLHFPKGTIVHFRCAGGGGYGLPHEREIERIQSDLDDGYVSLDAARELYGVEVHHEPDRAEGPWVARRPNAPGGTARATDRAVTK